MCASKQIQRGVWPFPKVSLPTWDWSIAMACITTGLQVGDIDRSWVRPGIDRRMGETGNRPIPQFLRPVGMSSDLQHLLLEQKEKSMEGESWSKLRMCDHGGLPQLRACINSYRISEPVLKNCLAVLAVWATFALALLICKYRNSILYG